MDAKDKKDESLNTKIDLKTRISITLQGSSEEIEFDSLDCAKIPIHQKNLDYTEFNKIQPISVEKCIYCGSIEEPLTKEHIIPASLSGTVVLPRASCEKCREITCKFEEKVVRGPLWPARIYLNLRSRNKHSDAPQHYSIGVEEINGEYHKIDVEIDRLPIIVPFPIFPLPAYIDAANYTYGISVLGNYDYNLGMDLDEVVKSLGVKSICRDVTYEPHAFASMIGKIALAWSYATKTIELVRDHSGLANAIIGKTNDIGCWVGTSNGELTVYPQLLHLIAEHPDKNTGLLLVYVKLFANYPTPEYCVIIGEMK